MPVCVAVCDELMLEEAVLLAVTVLVAVGDLEDVRDCVCVAARHERRYAVAKDINQADQYCKSSQRYPASRNSRVEVGVCEQEMPVPCAVLVQVVPLSVPPDGHE